MRVFRFTPLSIGLLTLGLGVLASGAVARARQASVPAPAVPAARAENLVLITFDGVRIEEMFGGLDARIYQSTLSKKRVEEQPLYARYWAPTAQERREKLMPFFWKTLMAQHGSIAGHRDLGSEVTLTNKHRFSYPGYAELLHGVARDGEVTSNDNTFYPYPTVLQFLKQGLSLRQEQVAAFASWETFRWIVQHQEGEITVNAGYMPYAGRAPGLGELSAAQGQTLPPWNSARYDYYTFRFAMDYLQQHKPRVLYLAFDETDDWAHQGNYERLLESLNRLDTFLAELWGWMEKDAQYRGRTAFVVTTDHGRGHRNKDWTSHGADVEGAQETWIAFVVPGFRLRGEWVKTDPIAPNQIAATLARLVGLDYNAKYPDAGKPVERLWSAAPTDR